MPRDLFSIMLNPTRMRIVQAFASHQTMTANALCGIICDVPRTTLYRQINLLIKAKVLTVVEETKVRGAVERLLSLNVDQLNKQNTLDNIPQKAFSFLMNTYAKFEKYFNRKHFTPEGNTVFFNNTILMMDDSEFDSFLSELQALLIKYHFAVRDGRKPRDISIISAPPLVNEDDEQQ